MLKAFSYMFKDNKFLAKIGTLYGLGLLSVLFIVAMAYISNTNIYLPITLTFLFAIVLGLVMFGYYISCIKAIATQKENIVLPYISFAKNIPLGAKYFLAGFLSTTAISLFGVIFSVPV